MCQADLDLLSESLLRPVKDCAQGVDLPVAIETVVAVAALAFGQERKRRAWVKGVGRAGQGIRGLVEHGLNLAGRLLDRWRGMLAAFLAIALYAVLVGDAQGQPDPETLQAPKRYTLLRTDRNGWIKLSTDGQRLLVEAERG